MRVYGIEETAQAMLANGLGIDNVNFYLKVSIRTKNNFFYWK